MFWVLPVEQATCPEIFVLLVVVEADINRVLCYIAVHISSTEGGSCIYSYTQLFTAICTSASQHGTCIIVPKGSRCPYLRPVRTLFITNGDVSGGIAGGENTLCVRAYFTAPRNWRKRLWILTFPCMEINGYRSLLLFGYSRHALQIDRCRV